MRLRTVLGWLIVAGGLLAVGAAVWIGPIARSTGPRLLASAATVVLIGAVLTTTAPDRLQRAGTHCWHPHTWPAVGLGAAGVVAVALAGGTIGGLGALGLHAATGGEATVETLLTAPRVRSGARVGLTVVLGGWAGVALVTVGTALTRRLGVGSGPGVGLAVLATLGVATLPAGPLGVDGALVAVVVLAAIGVGLYTAPIARRPIARVWPEAAAGLPPRNTWKHDGADAERAHRRAQRREPPVSIGEDLTIVVQEHRDGGRQVRGVSEDFQIFVRWDVPGDLTIGDRICVRIEDYGTNDAGQRTSGQARYLSRGPC